MFQTIQTPGDTDWFTHDRFGLFIHWGLYALGARHEQIQRWEHIPAEEYEARYFPRFDPDLYDPALWAKAASDAGMNYFVVTTKHHDGFCLWDSKLTDFKATNTPAKRDLLRPMVEAFREQNMRVGFYHSLIDWHHPQYTIDPDNHPLRNHPDRARLNQDRDQAKYTRYLHGQVRELLSKFGQVDILWLDYSFTFRCAEGKGREDWQSEKLVKIVRELQPKVILNDRLDLPGSGIHGAAETPAGEVENVPPQWDLKTPEQYQPRRWISVGGQPVVWEACQTFSGVWGYDRDQQSWRSTRQLIQTLIDCVSKGGNLLLNVGPTGRGEFDARALDRLQGIGRWMHHHSRAIYGCTQAPEEFQTPQDCRLTYHPGKKRLYVHLYAWPYNYLYLDGRAFVERVEYAQLLHDASEVPLGLTAADAKRRGINQEQTQTLTLPQQEPGVEVTVIELFLK